MSYEIHGKMIKRIADEAWIPLDSNNVDYREFLKWVEDGNKPEVKTS